LDLFPSSGEGKGTPTLLGPLERANLNHWTTHAVEVEVNLRPTVSRPVCPGARRPSGTCGQFLFSLKFLIDSWVFVEVEVEIEVNLRPTVSRPVCLGVRRPSGTCDQFFLLLEISLRQLRVCYFVAPSLTRGRVCKSRRTHDHILLSHLRLPQPGGSGSRIYISQKQGGPVIPPSTGFSFFRFLRLAGQRWRYSNQPPHGACGFVEAEGNLRPTVSRPVCPGVRRPSGSRDQLFFLLEISFRQLRLCYFVVPSLTRGRVCNLLVQLLLDFARAVTLGSKSRRTHDHILLSHLRLLQPGGPGSRIYIPQKQGSPVIPPGTGFAALSHNSIYINSWQKAESMICNRKMYSKKLWWNMQRVELLHRSNQQIKSP
jgi:hypothetical protein